MKFCVVLGIFVVIAIASIVEAGAGTVMSSPMEVEQVDTQGEGQVKTLMDYSNGKGDGMQTTESPGKNGTIAEKAKGFMGKVKNKVGKGFQKVKDVLG